MKPASCHRALIPGLLLGCLVLMLGTESGIAAGGWSTAAEEAIEGELTAFDFESKTAVFEDADGRRTSVPSAELSAESRWRLLLSPTFARSFPEDSWTPQQRRYLFLAGLGPSLTLLVSFYLCALILFKNGNPLRAIAGWCGSVLLGGFLFGFYVSLSSRNPTSATGVLIFGALVCLAVLSLYVSVIYGNSFVDGLKLLLLHVFGGFFFFAIALFVLQRVSLSFDLEPVIEQRILIPVGLLSEN